MASGVCETRTFCMKLCKMGLEALHLINDDDEADPEPYTLTSLRDGSGRQSIYQGYPEDKTDMRIY